MSILTISREFGSGGREIGQAVSEQLGYEYVDKAKILRTMGEQGKKWEEWAKGLDEHSPTLWERFDWSYRGFGALVRSIMLEYAVQDNVVLMERGGNCLLEGVPHALRIRVVAPLQERLERIMLRESVDYDTALWLTEKTDHDRRDFIRALFGREWDDPTQFDEVLDTSVKPVEEAAAMVCGILQARRDKKTPQVEETLRMRAACTKLEAGLLTYPFLFVNTLEVVVEGGDLVLKGVVRDPKQKKHVESIARKLSGDVPLKLRLHYRGE